MARHHDIDRAAAKLEGVQGWSIKQVTRISTKRKDKRGCVHYVKSAGSCDLGVSCLGAGSCPKYRRVNN